MKDKNRFYSSLALLIILNAIIKPVWIMGIDRQVQNQLGAEIYGTYFSLFNLSIVLNFLLDLGLTGYYTRELAAAPEQSPYAGRFLLTKIILAAAYALLLIIAGLVSGIHRWDILFYILGIQLLSSFFIFFRAMIVAGQWYATEAWLSVIDKTLMIIFCSLFLFGSALFGLITIQRFLQLQLLASLLALLVAIAVAISKGLFITGLQLRLPPASVFKAALPFTLIVLLMSLHNRADGFLLERLHQNGAYEAGTYASAYRLLDAANTMGFLAASFLFSFVARHATDIKLITPAILIIRHLLVVTAVYLAGICFFLSPWIQEVLYHHRQAHATEVLQYCIPSLIGYALIQVYGTVMTATGHIIAFCKISLAAVLVNLGLNIVLIPSLGATGACYSALVSQLSCGIAVMIFVNHRLAVPVRYRSWFAYLLLAGLLILFFSIASYYGVNAILQLVAAGLIVVLTSLGTGLFNLKAWNSFLMKPAH